MPKVFRMDFYSSREELAHGKTYVMPDVRFERSDWRTDGRTDRPPVDRKLISKWRPQLTPRGSIINSRSFGHPMCSL